jgi:hypothetical protein
MRWKEKDVKSVLLATDPHATLAKEIGVRIEGNLRGLYARVRRRTQDRRGCGDVRWQKAKVKEGTNAGMESEREV